MDLMRHVGRGELTPFAGGAPGNRALEQSVWRNSPYTEADLQAQIDSAARRKAPGARSSTPTCRTTSTGINAYIDALHGEPATAPASTCSPATWTRSPTRAGPQHVHHDRPDRDRRRGRRPVRRRRRRRDAVRAGARRRPGQVRRGRGDQVWAAFRGAERPGGRAHPAQRTELPVRGGRARRRRRRSCPTPGHRAPVDVTENATGSATAAATAVEAPAREAGVARRRCCPSTTGQAAGMSNAVVVSAANSATGHPVAVFGPQTGYFAPQLLMLQESAGPGHQARGARVRRAQLLRAARPRPGLRLERHLGRAGHHRHLRRASCVTRTAARRPWTRRTTSTTALPCRWRR